MGKHSVNAPSYAEQVSQANSISNSQLKLGEEQMAWGVDQDKLNQQRLAETLGSQGKIADDQARYGEEDRARYENVYRPMEDRMIADAESYDSPARRDKEQSAAMGDVATQFDAARKNALSRLEGYGVDPSETRNAALDVGVRTQEAMNKAQASTQAGNRVEDVGRAYKNYALERGDVLPGMAQDESKLAAGLEGAMLGEGLNTSASGAAMRTSGQGFTQMGAGANMDAANIKNTQFSNQLASQQMKNANKANSFTNIASIFAPHMASGGSGGGESGGGGMMTSVGSGGGGTGAVTSDASQWSGLFADGGKIGPRTALPKSLEFSFEDIDRHISEVYGASESNTKSKVLPRALPPAPRPAQMAIQHHGSTQPPWQMPESNKYSAGGPVDNGPTDGSGIDDQVSAQLSVGEYVIPADVVAAKGKEFFDKILSKYHTPAAEQRVNVGSQS